MAESRLLIQVETTVGTLTVILLIIVFVVLGLDLGSFLLVSGLICLFFGLPTAIRFARLGLFSSSAPAVRYAVSAVLLPALFTVATWLVWHYAPTYRYFFLSAAGFALLLGFGKLGTNPSNMQDFLTSNERYLDQSKAAELIGPLTGSSSRPMDTRPGGQASRAAGMVGGLVDDVVNMQSGLAYVVSTAREPGKDFWSTAILQQIFTMTPPVDTPDTLSLRMTVHFWP